MFQINTAIDKIPYNNINNIGMPADMKSKEEVAVGSIE